MKIWKLLPDTVNYSSLVMKPTISIDLIKSFDGRTQQATWNPILLDYSIDNEFFELSDYPSFSLPVCSKSAVTIFSEEIGYCQLPNGFLVYHLLSGKLIDFVWVHLM